jgi:hypothetical protein
MSYNTKTINQVVWMIILTFAYSGWVGGKDWDIGSSWIKSKDTAGASGLRTDVFGCLAL